MNPTPPLPRQQWSKLSEWIHTFALGLWGALFLFYWHSGKLGLLIHPNYFALSIGAGFVLLAIASLNLLRMIRRQMGWRESHQTLFSPLLMSCILLVAAIMGFLIAPRPFVSDTAIQRGLQDSAIVTRVRPQSFRVNRSSESRSLIDWIRTIDVYPEPDAYAGQKVSVDGFVVRDPNLPAGYFTLTRFVITCCAADVYPVGLPVRFTQSKSEIPADRWFKVRGKMATETLKGKRQVAIQASTVQPIPEPKNPYAY
ncbi:TIGR03943 family putative permease subunit [Altericista sp. CCNU0014]|uniref:TIGR03943 family putative permease subunit n=1 Tax=Altericista sp. CCNU0014 TaxID=3082949 RepID=UPI00384DC9AA